MPPLKLSEFDPTHELIATVALESAAVVPAYRLGALIDQVGSAVRLVKLDEEDRLFAWPEAIHELIGAVDDAAIQRAVAKVREWRERGYVPATVLDRGYPEQLHDIFNRPPLLFVSGALETRIADRAIAVVGARSAGLDALSVAAEITYDLVQSDFVIVSGLARGIDTIAHETALDAYGLTWAVLGSGLERVYPRENQPLAQRILSSGGALISQFAPDQPPIAFNFPKRNVVMSGLALATVVIEASQTSGARLQARVALQHGRTVFIHSDVIRRHAWAQKYATEGAYGTAAIEISHASEIVSRLETNPLRPIAAA